MECKENQSPLRPILKNSSLRRYDNPIPYQAPLHESTDATNRPAEINFSRKRTPSASVDNSSFVQAQSPHGSKRNKTNKHKRSKTEQNEPSIPLYSSSDMGSINKPSSGRTSLDLRPSKFREATMRDSPSAKPPSLFLRVMPKTLQQTSRSTATRYDPSGEHLIDAYLEEQSQHVTTAIAAPLMQTARSATRATQLSGLTHHANASISSSANSTANGSESSQSIHKESGIIKFGKNVKEAWLNLKSKSSKERTSKESAEAAAHASELTQRRLKAEKEYEAFKKEIKTTTITSRMQSSTQTTAIQASVGSTAMNQDRSNVTTEIRQSHRSLDLDRAFDMTASEQIASEPTVSQRISSVPGKDRGRFHFRTPSLQDLKRIASQSTLHRRAASSTVVPQNSKTVLVTSTASVELEERPSTSAGFSAYVKSARSKKELLKEQRLAKRVTELEEKLNTARKQLEKSRSMELLTAMQTPGAFDGETRPTSRARPESQNQNKQLKFQPLPTLQSESLLIADNDDQAPQNAFTEVFSSNMPSSNVINEPIIEVETPKRESDNRKSFGTPLSEPHPGSAFDSSSESSPEGILNAFRRSKAANNKPEGSPTPRKSPRRINHKARSSRGSIDRSTISAPILPESNVALDIIRRASLDTVSEEASIISSVRARFSPEHKTLSSPLAASAPFNPSLTSATTTTTSSSSSERPHRPRHRHTRSLSPIKKDFSLLKSLPGMTPSPNQFQHLRARSMSPLPSPPAHDAPSSSSSSSLLASEATTATAIIAATTTTTTTSTSTFGSPSMITTITAATATATAAAAAASSSSINFSRPVTPAAQLMRSTPPIPRLAPSREEWQWPEDVF